MTFLTKPAELENIAVAKKTSSAAVSSWGFSGYIAVLPKEDKPTVVIKPKDKQVESSQKTTESKCR